MPDIFSSARLLVRGAREDTERLFEAFDAYFKSEPYEPITEKDPNTGLYTFKYRITTNLPELLSRDTARIASELRSALDQAGYATALAAKSPRLKNTYFPFATDVTQIDNVVRGRCKDLPQEIATLFRSFNAYRGGDNLLWSVNEIANGVKHRFIVPVGQVIAGGHAKHVKGTGRITFPPVWDRTKDEIVLATHVKEGGGLQYDANLSFLVTFGDVEIVRDKPVVSVLEALATKVESIIGATEGESRRIGLIT